MEGLPMHSGDEDIEEVSKGDLRVVSYRLGALERSIESMSAKLESVGTQFITIAHADLLLDPIKNDIKEVKIDLEKYQTKVEAEKNVQEIEKMRFNNQLKLMTVSVFVSPVAAALVTYLAVR